MKTSSNKWRFAAPAAAVLIIAVSLVIWAVNGKDSIKNSTISISVPINDSIQYIQKDSNGNIKAGNP